MLGTADNLVFEGFRLDSTGLFRIDQAGVSTPVPLGSRAIALLGLLAGRCGELISKDEIMQGVWPHTIVEENNLTVQISALRRLLDAGRAEGSCIQNVPGRGYRFVASVTRVEPTVSDCPSMLGGDRSPHSGPGRPPPDASTYHNIAAASSVSEVRAQKRHWSARTTTLMGALGVLVILVAMSSYLHLPTQKQDPAPRLSIVVLPFANLSEDRGQQYVADGITDDLATDLSRRAHLFVISRNSISTYRDKPVDAKQIGRELGVRYLLEGSVRRVGNQIRVNAQLAATDTAAYLWAEQYDRDVTDLFAVQSEITRRIGNALKLQIITAEAGRPTANPDAFDYLLRGRLAIFHPRTRESYARAIALFEHALALDPNSVMIQSSLADALAGRVVDSLTGSAEEDIERAESLVAKALAAAPRSGFAHFVNGTVLRARRQCERAIAEFETVIALEPSSVEALADIGRCKIFIGPIEDAISAHEQAVRLSPNDPSIGIWYWRIGQAHLLLSRTSEAIHWLERARSVIPGLPFIHAHLAAAYGLKGESEVASVELAEARRLGGEGSYATIARIRTRTIGLFEVPATRALFEAAYLAGLRKAGMPED
jgi:TolB-like protein/DNA-binding winged helix-turn-helix (wHTH) protein/Tfp pilus assembly protein PilF